MKAGPGCECQPVEPPGSIVVVRTTVSLGCLEEMVKPCDVSWNGPGLSVLTGVGGGFLTQVISDALDRLRKQQAGHPPSQQDLEKGIAQRIQQVLAAGDARADALRGEIASVLKGIDAGGTALRAVMEQGNERVRGEVIAVIGALGSDFSEMGFLLHDVAQAAAEIQKSLD